MSKLYIEDQHVCTYLMSLRWSKPSSAQHLKKNEEACRESWTWTKSAFIKLSPVSPDGVPCCTEQRTTHLILCKKDSQVKSKKMAFSHKKSKEKSQKTDFSLTFHDWKPFCLTLPDFLFYRAWLMKAHNVLRVSPDTYKVSESSSRSAECPLEILSPWQGHLERMLERCAWPQRVWYEQWIYT